EGTEATEGVERATDEAGERAASPRTVCLLGERWRNHRSHRTRRGATKGARRARPPCRGPRGGGEEGFVAPVPAPAVAVRCAAGGVRRPATPRARSVSSVASVVPILVRHPGPGSAARRLFRRSRPRRVGGLRRLRRLRWFLSGCSFAHSKRLSATA